MSHTGGSFPWGHGLSCWAGPSIVGLASTMLVILQTCPAEGGRQEHLASCLAEWFQWVLGPLLIPQQLTLLIAGRRKGEKRKSALSPL